MFLFHVTPHVTLHATLNATQLIKRGAMNKYVEAEILNHSRLWHPHVIQFKVRDFIRRSLPRFHSIFVGSVIRNVWCHSCI